MVYRTCFIYNRGGNTLLKSDHSLVYSRSHSCSRALIWCLNWPALPPPPCTKNTHALEPGQERLMTRRDFPRTSSMLYPSSFLSTSSGLNMSIQWSRGRTSSAQRITWLLIAFLSIFSNTKTAFICYYVGFSLGINPGPISIYPAMSICNASFHCWIWYFVHMMSSSYLPWQLYYLWYGWAACSLCNITCHRQAEIMCTKHLIKSWSKEQEFPLGSYSRINKTNCQFCSFIKLHFSNHVRIRTEFCIEMLYIAGWRTRTRLLVGCSVKDIAGWMKWRT